MTYKEEIRDLFSVPDDYYLAHCISADFGMGKGIVVEFNKRFDMKRKLQTKYPNFVNDYHHNRWGRYGTNRRKSNQSYYKRKILAKTYISNYERSIKYCKTKTSNRM